MSDPAGDALESGPGRGFWDRAPQWTGSLIALVVLMVGVTAYDLASAGTLVFLSPGNLINVLQNWSFVGLLAVGMTFVIIAGGIDLSVGSLVAFAGGFGIWAMNHVIASGRGEVAGVLIGYAVILAAGAGAGILNGVLVTKGRIAPFIATLGGLAAYRSLALALADGGEFRSASASLFGQIGSPSCGIPLLLRNPYGTMYRLPWPVVIFLVVAALAWVVLNRTRYGRYVYAIGCNERAARYSAIRVDRVKIAAYTVLGGLTGLAALLNSSRMNSVGSGNTAAMWELDAIAAVVIGGTRMSGGAGSILGTVIGLLILGVIGNMLNLLQVSIHLQGLVKGLIIVAAVLIQRGGRRE